MPPPSPRSIFITGVTGFVGGSILSGIRTQLPDIHIKALVRKEEDAKKLQTIYSQNVECILGDLADLSLIAATSASVDLVIHAAHNNIPAVSAIIDGMASTPSESMQPRMVCITGPRSLVDLNDSLDGTARTTAKPWSDIEDAETILNFPKTRIHTEADQAVIARGIEKRVGVVLLSPGQIVGQGQGHVKQEGACAAYYAAVEKRGRAFVVGDGSASWSWVSMDDLIAAVVLVVKSALSEDDGIQQRIGVNREGYHFVRTGEFSMRERAEAVNKRLGLGKYESVTAHQAKSIHPFGSIMWGADIRFRADRLVSLGWKPKRLDWRSLMSQGRGERA